MQTDAKGSNVNKNLEENDKTKNFCKRRKEKRSWAQKNKTKQNIKPFTK